MPPNDRWLELVHEDIVEPALPILDPHHHLWFVSPLQPHRSYDYREAELERDLASGHNILATVFIECRTAPRGGGPEHLRPVGETEWVNGVAARRAAERPGRPVIAAGIVAHADLSAEGKVDEILEAHAAAAPQRLRGIRQTATSSDDPAVVGNHPNSPPHRLLDAAFRRGFARLAPHGLSFDCWVYHPQLPDVTALAQDFPGATIIVDHLGAPLGVGRYAGRQDEVFEHWRRGLEQLARCPNVYLKRGGSAMHMFGFPWEKRPLPPGSDELAAATGHFYHCAIDAFSPARCMFESNFPVDRERCSYAVLWNSFKKIAARYSDGERADLFCNTAARAYRLPEFLN